MAATTKKLMAKKLANALIGDAAGREDVCASLAWTVQFGSAGISSGLPATKELLKNFSKQMGGLWVGGSLFLFEDSLHFEANRMNEKLQTGVMRVDIPLVSIDRVSPRFGFITGIIDVVWTNGSMQYLNSFRCFGSTALVAQIQAAVDYAKKQAPAPMSGVDAS